MKSFKTSGTGACDLEFSYTSTLITIILITLTIIISHHCDASGKHQHDQHTESLRMNNGVARQKLCAEAKDAFSKGKGDAIKGAFEECLNFTVPDRKWYVLSCPHFQRFMGAKNIDELNIYCATEVAGEVIDKCFFASNVGLGDIMNIETCVNGKVSDTRLADNSDKSLDQREHNQH